LLANGFVFCYGLFAHEEEKNSEVPIDSIWIRATVKKTFWNKIKINDVEEEECYLHTLIETEFGDIELVHSPKEIKEDQRTKVLPGAIVEANVVLSGDPAILEYANGIVLNEKNNLHLLADVIEGGDAERLRLVLADDVTYYSETTQVALEGKENVVHRFKSVNSICEEEKFVNYAIIDKYKGAKTEGIFPLGTKCLTLAYTNPDEPSDIVFVELDSDSKIKRIYFTTDSDYIFRFCEE
jgi:hypothetical protein